MSLQELARWGVVPFTIKVVTAKSPHPNPAQIENKTSALAVVDVDEARERYRLKLKNTSAKPIIALNLTMPQPGGDYAGQFMQAGPERPLIARGAGNSPQLAATLLSPSCPIPRSLLRGDSFIPRASFLKPFSRASH